MFILVGKLFYLCVWGFLVFNLIFPFRYPANIVINIALAAMCIIHGLQALLLNATLSSQEKDSDRFKALRLFVFGIFEVLSWKNKRNR